MHLSTQLAGPSVQALKQVKIALHSGPHASRVSQQCSSEHLLHAFVFDDSEQL